MADVSTWSTTPGSNNSSPPDGWPEGQAASTVNDCARQMMAEIAEWYLDTKGSLTSTGSANAYVLATNVGHATLAAQSLLAFRANFGNTGAATLAVDGLAAKSLRIRGAALASGDIVSGSVVLVSYNATADAYDCHITSSVISAASGNPSWSVTTAAGSITGKLQALDSVGVYVGSASAHALSLVVNNDPKLSIDTSGNFNFFAGTVLTNNASASEVGFRGIPQNSQGTNYTAVLADAGKHLYGTAAITFTIPANASVAYPIGTFLTFVNVHTAAISIAITTDTMTLAATTTTGTRSLARNGIATAVKISSTSWLISGSGLS